MISKLTGAVGRAVLVVSMIAFPAILLPGATADTPQIVALVCLIAGAFTFVEYKSSYPSLLEFREAPPYNRIRFFALFSTVVLLTLIALSSVRPTTLTELLAVLGQRFGMLVDFPYSPVRLVVLVVPNGAGADTFEAVRTAASLSYAISLISIGAFWMHLRRRNWPARNGRFNVWTNLPTFDPTAGGDLVEKLQRSATVNLIIGFLLPFLVPALARLAFSVYDPINFANPHTLIWTLTAWAFIPASFLMRGIAMSRVAEMIANQRRRAFAAAKQNGEETALTA